MVSCLFIQSGINPIPVILWIFQSHILLPSFPKRVDLTGRALVIIGGIPAGIAHRTMIMHTLRAGIPFVLRGKSASTIPTLQHLESLRMGREVNWVFWCKGSGNHQFSLTKKQGLRLEITVYRY